MSLLVNKGLRDAVELASGLGLGEERCESFDICEMGLGLVWCCAENLQVWWE